MYQVYHTTALDTIPINEPFTFENGAEACAKKYVKDLEADGNGTFKIRRTPHGKILSWCRFYGNGELDIVSVSDKFF